MYQRSIEKFIFVAALLKISCFRNFNVPNVKGIESNTFYFNAIKDWNSLPDNLKNCENIHTYRKGVKRCLLQMATEEAGREYVYL